MVAPDPNDRLNHMDVSVFLEGEPVTTLARADCSAVKTPYVYKHHKQWYARALRRASWHTRTRTMAVGALGISR